MIPFAQPRLDGNELKYVTDAVETGWISGVGNYVSRFEQKLAEIVGVKHVIATANGTLSLEVILMAMGIGAGDEVIVPALTFVSPAAAVRRVGARPVFADISPYNWCIDPESVEKVVTKNTKAIIAVDLLGMAAPMAELEAMALPVIEDAAEAHGAVHENGALCGSRGLAASFSFHPNKVLTMGEGGAILTDWDWLAKIARKIGNHGMDYPYSHDVVGTNARANNLTCAIGLAQLENWQAHVDARNRIRQKYHEALKGVVGLQREYSSTWVVPIIPITHHKTMTPAILAALKRGGVDARPIFTPLCDLIPYRDSAVLPNYPIARAVGESVILLPTHEGVTDDDIQYIASIIRETVNV